MAEQIAQNAEPETAEGNAAKQPDSGQGNPQPAQGAEGNQSAQPLDESTEASGTVGKAGNSTNQPAGSSTATETLGATGLSTPVTRTLTPSSSGTSQNEPSSSLNPASQVASPSSAPVSSSLQSPMTSAFGSSPLTVFGGTATAFSPIQSIIPSQMAPMGFGSAMNVGPVAMRPLTSYNSNLSDPLTSSGANQSAVNYSIQKFEVVSLPTANNSTAKTIIQNFDHLRRNDKKEAENNIEANKINATDLAQASAKTENESLKDNKNDLSVTDASINFEHDRAKIKDFLLKGYVGNSTPTFTSILNEDIKIFDIDVSGYIKSREELIGEITSVNAWRTKDFANSLYSHVWSDSLVSYTSSWFSNIFMNDLEAVSSSFKIGTKILSSSAQLSLNAASSLYNKLSGIPNAYTRFGDMISLDLSAYANGLSELYNSTVSFYKDIGAMVYKVGSGKDIANETINLSKSGAALFLNFITFSNDLYRDGKHNLLPDIGKALLKAQELYDSIKSNVLLSELIEISEKNLFAAPSPPAYSGSHLYLLEAECKILSSLNEQALAKISKDIIGAVSDIMKVLSPVKFFDGIMDDLSNASTLAYHLYDRVSALYEDSREALNALTDILYHVANPNSDWYVPNISYKGPYGRADAAATFKKVMLAYERGIDQIGDFKDLLDKISKNAATSEEILEFFELGEEIGIPTTHDNTVYNGASPSIGEIILAKITDVILEPLVQNRLTGIYNNNRDIIKDYFNERNPAVYNPIADNIRSIIVNELSVLFYNYKNAMVNALLDGDSDGLTNALSLMNTLEHNDYIINTADKILGDTLFEYIFNDLPPTISNNSFNVIAGASAHFNLSDFSGSFIDADGDSLSAIKIVSLPQLGGLRLNGQSVSAGQEIAAADISGLTYTPNASGNDSFKWSASDGLAWSQDSATMSLAVTAPPDSFNFAKWTTPNPTYSWGNVDLALGDAGQFVLAYIGERAPGWATIYFQMFNDDGRVGNAFRSSQLVGHEELPKISLYRGDLVLLYQNGGSAPSPYYWVDANIYFEAFDLQSHQRIIGPTSLYKYDVWDARDPDALDVATLRVNGEDSGVVFVYSDMYGYISADIYGGDIGNGSFKREVKVSNFASTYSSDREISVAGTSDGGFIVSYEKADSSGSGVWLSRFSSSGNKVNEFLVNTSVTDGRQFDPYVCGMKNGGYAVTWKSGNDIYIKVFDGDDVQLAVEEKVNSFSSSALGQPCVAQLESGLLLAVFGENNLASYAQIFNEDGTKFDRNLVDGEFYGSNFAIASDFYNGYDTTYANKGSNEVIAMPDGGFAYGWQSHKVSNYTHSAGVSIASAVFFDCSTNDPIVFDLNNDGVIFDYSSPLIAAFGDDVQQTQLRWFSPNDAVLAIDSDNNGQIQGMGELFADLSGKLTSTEVLATFDLNHDERIDDKDDVFRDLIVWSDRNSNGISEADEMSSIRDAGIISIDLHTTPSDADPAILSHGTATMADGSSLNFAEVIFQEIPQVVDQHV